jgi:DNA polymerase
VLVLSGAKVEGGAIKEGSAFSSVQALDIPEELLDWIQAGKPVIAHNAEFDLGVWNGPLSWRRLGKGLRIHTIMVDQVHCTAARARAVGLPPGLDMLAQVLWPKEDSKKKDMAGRRLCMQLCKPDANGRKGHHTDQNLARLAAYCAQDVAMTAAVHIALPMLSTAEHEVWKTTVGMNGLGMPYDRVTASHLLSLQPAAREYWGRYVEKATGREVKATDLTRVAKLADYCGMTERAEEGEPADDGSGGTILADVGADEDAEEESARGLFDAAAIAKKLEELDGIIAAGGPMAEDAQKIQAVLLSRQAVSKTSGRKIAAMNYATDAAQEAGLLRGMFIYHGAGTGRWSSTLVQFQNLPRESLDEEGMDDLAKLLEYFDKAEGRRIDDVRTVEDLVAMLGDCPITLASKAIRGLLWAGPPEDGKVLHGGDLSQIEARIVLWLAGDPGLALFAPGRTGADIYQRQAFAVMRAMHHPETPANAEGISKKYRNMLGKPGVLGGGFGMGAQRCSEQYGLDLKAADAIIQAYRQEFAEVPAMWRSAESAAMGAVRSPRIWVPMRTANHKQTVAFYFAGGTLWCRLPSGRKLAYQGARIEQVRTPWGEWKDAITYWAMNQVTKKWEKFNSYGGLLIENIVQAAARDLIARSMVRAARDGRPWSMSIHDEGVAVLPLIDTPPEGGDSWVTWYLVTDQPAWSEGLPLAAEGWIGRRFRK